jgi:uncharacterized protein YjbI with pentapeptide repeats
METKMIGNKIAKARKDKSLSQAELGDQLFISPQAVGKWERGESLPDLTMLSRLAKLLSVDLNYFSDDFQGAPKESREPKPNFDMSRGNWVDADFSEMKNLHEKFSSSNLQRCRFIDSDLSGLLLRSNHVDSCDFRGSEIRRSRIQNSHLANNLFQDCAFQETEFSGSHIQGCNFTGADFTGSTFRSCSVRKNILAGALWNATSFIGSDLDNLTISGTLTNCAFENCSFTKLVFENATLTNTFFKNKKLKGISFINCLADRLTYEFLKNGKADLTGVTQL